MEKKKWSPYDRVKARTLMKELHSYEEQGMGLYLNGKKCQSADILNACMIAEEQTYMRDYIGDEKERIREINFIRVSS